MSIAATGISPPPPPSSVGSNTSSTSGLVFSGNLATYNGQPIALSTIQDDNSGKFTQAQQLEANKVQSAAEYNAFGKYAGSNTQAGNKQYVVAYINYVQNLPPYEQNSQRYAGTLQSAQNLLNEINNTPNDTSNSSTSTSQSGTSQSSSAKGSGAIEILQSLEKALKGAKSGKSTPVDVVDLSPTAQSYLSTTNVASAPGQPTATSTS